MEQSAGSVSVAAAITRNQQGFNAGVMLSGAPVGSANVPPDFEAFNDFSNAVNCRQSPGPARLACLKRVPAAVIRNFTNRPSSETFGAVIDNQTFFGDSIGRILAHQSSAAPLMVENTQNDSSLFVLGQTDLAQFLQTGLPSADQIRSLYPGRTDIQVIGELSTDLIVRCPVSLWAATERQSGVRDVYRYSYGSVFPDTQLFPNAGAWHSSELELIFGTFTRTTSGNNKVILLRSLQTAIANFVKDPSQLPARDWSQYDPNRKTLAELAFNGNVDFDNFVNPVTSATEDGTCKRPAGCARSRS
ncbi:alpha/beta-hydrolase [Marasmius fiardii PR-910]|nr:alpha/beta-hydrolase [Marasmius fiardii PR-910]